MEYIKRFIGIHKKDLYCLSFLLILFIGLSFLYGPVFGTPWVDCGREAYIPEAMLKGKLLYKDIFALFSPLSYQINALLYAIFGVKFSVIYLFSYFNAALILFGMYLICRLFLDEIKTSVFIVFLMGFMVFLLFTCVYSYIFPYAYAYIYSLLFFTFSVLLFLCYMKNDDKNLLYGSVFLLGIAFANKHDFLPCILSFICVLALKKEPPKTFLILLFLIILPNILSWGALFLQGLTINDIKNELDFYYSFFFAPEQLYFTKNFILSGLNLENFTIIFKCFLLFSSWVLMNTVYFYFFNRNKYLNTFLIALIPIIFVLNGKFVEIERNVCFMEKYILSFEAVLILIVLTLKIRNIKSLREQMLFFTGITGLLCMARIGFLPVQKYSSVIYYLLCPAALWIYFWDAKIKIFGKTDYKKYISTAIITVSVFMLAEHHLYGEYSRYGALLKFESDKGCLISEKYHIINLRQTVDFIKTVSRPEDKVLVIPEGEIINHLTERQSVDKIHQITPNHISAVGEDNIVKIMNENMPEFVITVIEENKSYGVSEIGYDYAFKIYDFVEEHYNLKKVMETPTNHHDKDTGALVIFRVKIYQIKNYGEN